MEKTFDLDNNINPEVTDFLKDTILDPDEAQALTDIFDANKTGKIIIWKENLAKLRKFILSSRTENFVKNQEKNIIKGIAMEKSFNLDNNINPELNYFLKDTILDPEEAQALTDIFEANKKGIIIISEGNLVKLRKSIWSKRVENFIRDPEKKIIAAIASSWRKKNQNHSILPEQETITQAEVVYSNSDIFKQAKKLTKWESEALQSFLWFTIWKWIDGDFWKLTLTRYKKKNPKWSGETISEFISRNKKGIEAQSIYLWDKVLWWKSNEYEKNWTSERNAEKEFRQKYGEFTETLWDSLLLPEWFINAIIHQETDFWLWRDIQEGKWINRKLASGTGSKGIMQLTRWPFLDMRWFETVDWKLQKWNGKKTETYRELFRTVNVDKIKTIDMWNWRTIWDTLPGKIWNDLERIQETKTTTAKSQAILKSWQVFIKWRENKERYFHTLNIIIWSVYLKYLHNSKNWNMFSTAESYNWDIDKKSYAQSVMEYQKNEFLN
jgi:hypothetical protein